MVADPIPISAARRPFRRDGLGYVWEIAERGVELRADYIAYRGNDMTAQVTVMLNGKHLHMANYWLSGTRSRHELCAELDARTRRLEIRWADIIEQFCTGVLGAERQGQPTQYASTSDKRLTSYVVDYLVIKNKANLLFAPGGSGKGMLTVGLCCAVASKRGLGSLTTQPALPFYFDWEDDFETFNDRLNAVARGMGVDVPELPYRRMRGLVSDRINEMARAISDTGATLGIIDSFSAAGGTVSDRGASWDAIAHRLFDALDLVPDVSWLIIDHVSGENVGQPNGKAYGSIQKMNRARNAWEMRSEQEPGSGVVHMKLFDAKWNHTGKRRPIGIRMDFEGDAVQFSAEDVSATVAQHRATLSDRMANELNSGPLSTAVLALSLDVSQAAVRTELSRNGERFERNGPYIQLATALPEGDEW